MNHAALHEIFRCCWGQFLAPRNGALSGARL